MMQEVETHEVDLPIPLPNNNSQSHSIDAGTTESTTTTTKLTLTSLEFVPNYTVNIFGVSPEKLASITEHHTLVPFKNVLSISQLLQSDSIRGIYSGEPDTIDRRRKIFGSNRLPIKTTRSFLSHFFHAIFRLNTILLSILAVFDLVFGVFLPSTPEARAVGWIEGAIILLALLVISTTTALLCWGSEKIWSKLLLENEKCIVRIIRHGQHLTLPIQEIVVGDVVELQTGEIIPADGLVLEQSEALQIDECIVNGRDTFCSKEVDPFLMAGTKVMQGYGKMVVTAVGTYSQFGKTVPFFHNQFSKETPFLNQIHRFCSVMKKAGLLAAGAKLIILIFGWFIRKFVLLGQGVASYDTWEVADIQIALDFALICSIIYALATTHTFVFVPAVVAMRMFKTGLLLRKPKSVEISNKLTTLCIGESILLDQKYQPKIKEAVIGGTHYGDPLLPNSSQQASTLFKGDVLTLLAESISLNSTAYLLPKQFKKSWQNQNKEGWVIQGSTDEGALLIFLRNCGIDYNVVRQKYASRFQAMSTFSAATKSMTTLVQKDDATFRKYTKGAVDFLLPQCSQWINSDGLVREFTLQQQKDTMNLVDNMAVRGLRTLCFVYCDAKKQTDFVLQENKLTLIGIMALDRTILKDIPQYISKCEKGGIQVKLVSGDHILTANYLAKACGIIHGETSLSMDTSQFRSLSFEQKQEIVPYLQVLSRCTGQDKSDLFEALHHHEKLYVGMTCKTGEDATICNKTDIGISLQKSGTQVVRDVSDWILLDDSFITLFKGIHWGRTMYFNLKKFFCFQISTSLVLGFYLLATAIVNWFILPYAQPESNGRPSQHLVEHFGPVQLLRIKLIEEGFVCVSYALEPPLKSLLYKPPQPHRHFRHIINVKNWFIILINALYQFVWLIVLQYAGIYILEPYYTKLKGMSFQNAEQLVWIQEINSSMVYHTFILCTLVSIVIFRQVELDQNIFEGLWKNPFMLLSMLLIFIIEIIIVVIPWNPIFETRQLDWPHWVIAVSVAVLLIPFIFINKAIARGILHAWKNLNQSSYLKRAAKKAQDEKKIKELKEQSLIAEGSSNLVLITKPE